MSIENHPHINAAGWVTAIWEGFHHYLRGEAVNNSLGASEILHDRVIKFVTEISEELDKKFGG